MLQKITRQIVYPFSRSQNFFEMNPVYPDMGEKDFDLYNTQRKKICPLDEYMGMQARKRYIRKLVREKIYLGKFEKYKKYTGSKKFKVDEETNLLVGLDSEFDEFISDYKANKLVTKNAKSEFKNSLLKLVHKFNCKSEAQLIRLFRIQIANSKKKSLLQKMRGKIMEQALMKASAMRRMSNMRDSEAFQQQFEQEQFEKILNQLDEKIEKVQQSLRFNEYGIPKTLSNYDPKYGWKIDFEEKQNLDYEFMTKTGFMGQTVMRNFEEGSSIQDDAIAARINRLYFLRRLELLKTENSNHAGILQDLPINLNQRQNIMNQLAYKYKQQDLIQQPDLEEIYREIDIVIDKIFIKVGPSYSGNNQRKGEQIFDRAPQPSAYLWDNISAQEILCPGLYNYETLKNTKADLKSIRDVSPNPDLQLTLSNLPINLYRHTEFEIFGIFNEYKLKGFKDSFTSMEKDYEPHFRDFNIEEASKQYDRFDAQAKQGQQTAFATAKRKTARCEVFITKGTGLVTINGISIQDYYADVYCRVETLKPLFYTDTSGLYDLKFNVAGGGKTGQAECMSYALSRALMTINPDHRSILSSFGMVGYDTRQKEAKKKNLYSARVRPPYVRR